MKAYQLNFTGGSKMLRIEIRKKLRLLAFVGMAVMVLAACQSPGRAQGEGEWVPSRVARVYDTDVLIVGGGGAGLASAVQLAQNGADFILIEKAAFLGGNSNFVEGMLAVGSRFQKEQGIEIRPRDIIYAELLRNQFRPNGALWVDLIQNSAENIEWLAEQGVLFSGVIDDYYGGLFPTFHWFEGAAGGVAYVPAMQQRLIEHNAAIHLNTAARSLIVENGRVTGVFAETPGGAIRYNAKVVILASGGFGGSPELIRKQGWDTTDLRLAGMPLVSGDGYQMAMAAGAKDFMPHTAQSIIYHIEAFPFMTLENALHPVIGYFGPASGGPVLWANEDAARFANEAIRTENLVLQSVPGKSNRANYVIFDQAIYEEFFGINEEARELFEEALAANKGNSIFREHSIEALAGRFGLDPVTLRTTVSRYNQFAVRGEDGDFGKPAEFLVPIATPPFYIAQLRHKYYFSVGGITTNRQFQVVDKNMDPIPGLYAIGLDGNMLWRNVYTINMPGAAFASQVNSGRTVANHVLAYTR